MEKYKNNWGDSNQGKEAKPNNWAKEVKEVKEESKPQPQQQPQQDNFDNNFGEPGESVINTTDSNFSNNFTNPNSEGWSSSQPSFTQAPDSSRHLSVRCDECKVHPLLGRRYKCLDCKNFDYCEACYLKHRLNSQHSNHSFNCITKVHPMSNTVFSLVSCDGCGMRPVVCERYNCLDCQNFDYCKWCYERNQEVHKHNFKKYT
mmetsp:Transcript_8649/g.9003  ORF Transcript_8649/g.9003 Transcript_8649/m.9003 type:complete len:203 (-) Transcript_8649:40-648(-)